MQINDSQRYYNVKQGLFIRKEDIFSYTIEILLFRYEHLQRKTQYTFRNDSLREA